MDNLGGDNKQQNTPAEIYANIRDKALEEAALAVERSHAYMTIDIPSIIRALKAKP